VLDTLAEIQERSRAVKDLEASLLELHQIFLDMAVLVEAQGEMLDNIEKQVRCMLVRTPRVCQQSFCFMQQDVALLVLCWDLPSGPQHSAAWHQFVGGCAVDASSYSICESPEFCCMLLPPQVTRSVEYVQSGTVALQDAKTLQKKTRKWMCCAIILLLVTAAVIVIVVGDAALTSRATMTASQKRTTCKREPPAPCASIAISAAVLIFAFGGLQCDIGSSLVRSAPSMLWGCAELLLLLLR
jgi:hypothetical protein